MKRLFLLLPIFLTILSAKAEVTLGFPGEESAYVGIYIKDLATGEVIAENDLQKAMMPASVMKAVTAATALTTLGNEFKYTTNIYATGEIEGGVLKGNLVVESCGDPTIDSGNFKERTPFCEEVAAALKKKGITKIQGKVVINETLSDAGCIPEWEIDDVAWAYGAGLYGMNYRDNKFTLWPASKRTMPHVPDLNVTLIQSSSEDLIRGVFSDNLYVYGPKLSNEKWAVSTTMNSPAEVVKFAMVKELEKNGITVEGKNVSSTKQTLVCAHKSPTLNEILREMLVHSHNLYAEAMLRAVSAGNTRNSAIKKELALWKQRGVYTDNIKICDGSGLSRADRLRPTFIGDVLEWMAQSEYADDYTAMFPVVGIDGTVKSFLANSKLRGKLALKTGSMNAVQCYAGYKLDDDGHPSHVVVILINSFFCDRSTLRKSIEEYLKQIF